MPPYLAGDMMKYTRTISIAVIFVSLSISLSQAQTLRDNTTPAEFPPASYQGAQYVDSKGCVYIRAGIDGNVTWVPRVNRQRQLICGQTPTLGKPQTMATEQPATQTTGKTAKAIAVAAPVTPVAAPVMAKPVVAKPKRPAAATTPMVSAKPPVRTARVSATKEPGPLTRVVPLHVYAARSPTQEYVVPKGYKRAWTDDRLNPRRAEQNLNGIASTRLIWTRTVPRRLIDQGTGRDVTATVPLVYPYTDVNTQERELGKVTVVRVNGRVKKRVERNRAKSRSLAPTKKNVHGRYVQVGTFKNPANASAAAQKVAQSGLPAGIGNVRRLGKTYQVVVAGPFPTSKSLRKGLRKAQAIGFGDAFVRN